MLPYRALLLHTARSLSRRAATRRSLRLWFSPTNAKASEKDAEKDGQAGKDASGAFAAALRFASANG